MVLKYIRRYYRLHKAISEEYNVRWVLHLHQFIPTPNTFTELVALCHPVRPDLVYQCIIFAVC